MKKTFDCVEMMHRGAEQVQARLRGMTREERVDYWRQRTEELRKRQQQLREALAAADSNAGSPPPREAQVSDSIAA